MGRLLIRWRIASWGGGGLGEAYADFMADGGWWRVAGLWVGHVVERGSKWMSVVFEQVSMSGWDC